METHKYEPLTEERFQEIMKLQEMLLHKKISLKEYESKVSDNDRANFRILAQIKFRDER